jgi:hypothetical protein
MKLRNAGRLVVTSTAAVLAISLASGAFATTVERFNYCMENQSDTDSVATRISCCKEAGGAWVEIYDPDGNVVDGFCDGAEEVYEPEEARPIRTANPALLDNVVSGGLVVGSTDPTPAAERGSDGSGSLAQVESEPTPAPEIVSEDPSSPSLEEAEVGSDPAPKKVKRKHRQRSRHRR